MTPDPGIIIVSGSHGRIGDAVTRRLAGRFQDVVGFDCKAPTPPPPGCVHIPIDITSDGGRAGRAPHHPRPPREARRLGDLTWTATDLPFAG